VSDKPAAPGSSGPPSDCKVIVYGTDVRASFQGLRDSSGKAVSYESLPKRKYLLVEYYATWCQPCVAARQALDGFFSSSSHAKDYLLVSIDMSRLPEAQDAARGHKPISRQKGPP
jgi:thiol-disulfide isomerase/thioredoxin